MPQPLDAEAVGRWCRIALDGLGSARESIDAINVYPVADQDTGTNLYLTLESAAQAVEAVETAGEAPPTLEEAVRTLAHGALIGARGNSGTIVSQLLRGMADVLAAGPEPADGDTVRRALGRAVAAGYEAVAHPVEGTMLSVAAGAAAAADRAPAGAPPPDVVAAACAGARDALARTPAQLDVLARAGVVDAGGSGLLAVLEALDAALSGRPPPGDRHRGLGHGALPGPGTSRGTRIFPSEGPTPAADTSPTGAAPRPVPSVPAAGCADHPHGKDAPGHEVTYLLDAPDEAVAELRGRLDRLGDSLVVVGGDGLFHIHLHTADPGAAVEAGIEAGRPHRVRITYLGGTGHAHRIAPRERAPRAVIALMPGEGLAALCAEAGAVALTVRPGEPPGSGELAAAVDRTGAAEVALLPYGDQLWHAASAAAGQMRAAGVRVAVIPARSPVQSLAALAVHAPERRFDEDVVAMTSAAGATRFGELTVAEHESWTSAGICQAGDLLGMIDGDVAVIGTDAATVATEVLARMLSGGGELVTLVLGSDAPTELSGHLERWVRRTRLGVETLVCQGRQTGPLLIGVE